MNILKCKCGEQANYWIQIYRAGVLVHWIECPHCLMHTDDCNSKLEAFVTWNAMVQGLIRPTKKWELKF
jgi:hypothetical protein